jgi:recombination protein RecR
MHSPTIQKLINLFSKFPTIGPRTASRFVFYLLRLNEKEIKELTSAILKLKENVKLCKLCYKSFEPSTSSGQKAEGELCEICQDPRRDKSLICLVEKETDLISIEKTRKYQGLYFILGGTVSVLKKDYNPPTTLPSKGRAPELKKLRRIQELLERVKNPEIKEIIIALNPITEGEATALYLERTLKPLGKKTTRLGRGLPFGGELEYADEETLSSALEGRK